MTQIYFRRETKEPSVSRCVLEAQQWEGIQPMRRKLRKIPCWRSIYFDRRLSQARNIACQQRFSVWSIHTFWTCRNKDFILFSTSVHLSLNISKILHSQQSVSPFLYAVEFQLSVNFWTKKKISKVQGLPPILSFPPINLPQWGLTLKCSAATVIHSFSRRSQRHKSKAVTVSLWLIGPTRAASSCQCPGSHNKPSRTLYGIRSPSKPIRKAHQLNGQWQKTYQKWSCPVFLLFLLPPASPPFLPSVFPSLYTLLKDNLLNCSLLKYTIWWALT